MALIKDRALSEKFRVSTRSRESRNLQTQQIRIRCVRLTDLQIAPLNLAPNMNAINGYLSGRKVLSPNELVGVKANIKLGLLVAIVDFSLGCVFLAYGKALNQV